MTDLDITGPLPIARPDGPPPAQPGWIPADQHGGADPDLPWDFATEVGTYDAGPATAEVPVEPVVPVVPVDPVDPVVPVVPVDPVVPDVPLAEAAGPGVEETPPSGAPPLEQKSRHGQPAPLSRAWNAGVAATIAVAAVVVGIVTFNHASTSPPSPGAGPAFVLPTAAANPGGLATASSPPGLSALPATPASGAEGAKRSAAARSTPAASTGVPANAPSITVLNETRTHGLAAAEAEKLRGAGWTVRRVTNVNARQPQTTVFYDASQESAAKALVASVPSIKVALPRPSYLLPTGGLIVVVASDAA